MDLHTEIWNIQVKVVGLAAQNCSPAAELLCACWRNHASTPQNDLQSQGQGGKRQEARREEKNHG